MDQSAISKKPNLFNDKSGVDCKFLVGDKDTEEISGHKVIFANSSPVFYKMFFGSVPEKGDEIKIPDIQPEAFRTMADFLYTGEVKFTSVEHAVQVWYAAHKYDLGKLTQDTISYLKNNVTPKNVCYILEFAISFENETIKNYCREVILKHISTILNDPSFLEADLSVLSFILDQNELEVSEVDLFKGLLRYFNAQKNILEPNSVESSSTSSANSESGDPYEKEVGVPDGNSVNSVGERSSNKEGTDPQVDINANCSNPLKELVKKIRFLSMTLEEFEECFAMSSLLSDSEALSIMFNIRVSRSKHLMPEGFSKTKNKREPQGNVVKTYPYLQMVPRGPVTLEIANVTPTNLPRYIKLGNQNHVKYYGNHADRKSDSDLSFSNSFIQGFLYFKTNIHILITGVQVINPPRSTNYSLNYVTCRIKLLNERNTNLFSYEVNITNYKSDSFVDIPFECPFYIDAKRTFIISVSFQYVNPFCPYKCLSSCKVNTVIFQFKKSNQVDCECKGLIRSLVFNNVEDTDCNNE